MCCIELIFATTVTPVRRNLAAFTTEECWKRNRYVKSDKRIRSCPVTDREGP
jgi:hypothetical protein